MKPNIILKPVIRTTNRSSNSDEKLLKNQGNLCFYCSKLMRERDNSSVFHKDGCTKDHFFPKSHGFDLCGNKVFACGECNNAKANSYPTPCDVIRFVDLHSSMSAKERRKLIVVIKNNKPRFKLKMTYDLINYYCR